MSSTGTTIRRSICLLLGGAAMVTGRAPPRNEATSSAGRTVADKPIRWAGPRSAVSASSRSSDRARCAPRLLPASACTSSTMTVSTPRSASRAREVSSRNSDSGVVMRMSGGLLASRRRSSAAVSPVRTATLISGSRCPSAALPGGSRSAGRAGCARCPPPGPSAARCTAPGSAASGRPGRGRRQPVQRPQERGQRLARPGRRDHEGVVTLADSCPGLGLRLRGRGERAGEPVPGRRAEALPGGPCSRRPRRCRPGPPA